MRIDYENHPDFARYAVDVRLDLSTALRAIDLTFMAAANSSSRNVRQRAESDLYRQVDQILDALRSEARDPHLEGLLSTIRPLLHELVGHEIILRRKAPPSENIYLEPRFDGRRFFQTALRGDTLAEILQLTEESTSLLRARLAEGASTREELSINSGPLIQDVARLVQKECEESETAKHLADYFGPHIEVGGVALELSPKEARWWRARSATHSSTSLYCHVDERIDLPKAIIYLNDVGADNGPFSVFPNFLENLSLPLFSRWFGRLVGTAALNVPEIAEQSCYHRPFCSERLRKAFMLLPNELRFQSHFGWDVQTGSEIEEELARSEIVFLGQAGTTIVFDGGELVHRGGLTTSGDRLALQVVFRRRPSLARKVRYRVGKLCSSSQIS